MELNTIKNTGNWGNSAANLNENFSKVGTEVDKLKYAAYNSKLYATEALLKLSVPSPKVGDWAIVGDSIPGEIYQCNADGVWTSTGKTGGGFGMEVTEKHVTEQYVTEVHNEYTGDIINTPDDEDLISEETTEGSKVLKLADKAYNASVFSGMGRVYMRKNIVGGKNVLTQAMTDDAKTRYVIQYDYDLNGQTISIPENCVLQFEGGSLRNGIIIGNGTTIVAPMYPLFFNVIIRGTWSQKEVYSDWFDFYQDGTDNIANFRNLMALSTSDYMTDVYISAGEYHTSVFNVTSDGNISSEGIRVPSNTHVHNSGTIKAMANSHEKTSIFFVSNAENVIIEGGRLIGDVRTHTGTTGEWGYGIALVGARNTTIRDMSIEECWGDGINVQSLYSDYVDKTTTGHCRRILIDNVKSLNNRRQGLSIEGCIGIVVRNSEFSGTGSVSHTAPGAGIDIEPWYAEQVVSDVVIESCKLYDNKNYLLVYGNDNTERISISNCESDRGLWIRTSNVNVHNWKTLGNGSNGHLALWGTCHNINVTNSRFTNELYGKGDLQNILINNCIFDMVRGGVWSGFAVTFENADADSVYRNIILSNNYFKDSAKLRFISAQSSQTMKIDFIGNEIITASQYGFDLGYGDFIGNKVILTNSNNHSLGLSVKNLTDNTVTIKDSSFKLSAYTENMWIFSGSTVVSDEILYDFDIANVTVDVSSVWKLFGGGAAASALKVKIQNCNFGRDITSEIIEYANWSYINGNVPIDNFAKSISPAISNATENKCYEYIVPYKRGYVEIMTSNKYTTNAALYNTLTKISMNPDTGTVDLLPSEIIGTVITVDSSDLDVLPSFGINVDGGKLHIYIKSPNNTVFGLKTRLTANYQENIGYSSIKYNIVSVPNDVSFYRKISGIAKINSLDFSSDIDKYLGWKVWDSNSKEKVYDGKQWINQDGTLSDKVVII